MVTAGHQDVKQIASAGVPGGAFPVVFGGPMGSLSMTFHHPIGVTPLASDEWVATPTEEVTLLLARAKHPGAEQNSRGYETHRLTSASALEPALLTLRNGRFFYPGDDNTTRDQRLEAAREVAVGKLAQGVNPTRAQIIAELPERLRGAETALQTHIGLEATRNAARVANPLAVYETRGGPLGDRRQGAIAPLKGMSSQAARDHLIARLCSIT
jgi:hypothetical protein